MPAFLRPGDRTTGSYAPRSARPVAAPAAHVCCTHFLVRTDVLDDAVVLRLSGELDRAAVPCLLHAVERALVRGRHRLVLDMEALRFCDAGGVGGLITARRAAEAVAVRMFVARPSRLLRRLLSLCRVSACFPTLP
ncbi:STAS domain-containing protein [Streptacidiphilus fuscans]|uniref:Anti-sigma factor antagonist n=1 Tax=Streptacidiphilus fuscans TaxID=2789292 RepID=A0A931B0U3_9ACTN|nr:STAS domain-containing protein [Streptacidiphilus fuscans]MBF9066856.1 STAS domain-containing protein [Streptacidiphilus fuscans]